MILKNLLALAAVGSVLVGCGGTGAGVIGQNQPRTRLFNGMDAQPSITATYKDATLTVLGTSTSAAFGAATNDTIVTNTNVTATINSPSATLFTTAASLLRVNSFYTVYTGGTSSANYKGLVLADSQSAATAGNINVRAVQVGANAGAVDVYISSTTPTLTPTTAIFTNLTFGNVTAAANSTQAVDANGYIAEPVANNTTYYVVVTAHGLTTPLVSTQVTFVQGTNYTVAVYDPTSGPGAAATVVTDNRTG